MQVHADTLTFSLQSLRQLQGAKPQAFLASARFGFHDCRPFGLIGSAYSEEVRRQKIGDDAGILDILHVIEADFMT